MPALPESAEPASERQESAAALEAEVNAREPRNLRVLAAYQVAHRIAWIFKTESVIMPAFMDTIAGPGWLRGLLPVLNRFGQSVPTLVAADPIRRMRQKKWGLMASAILMGIPFTALGVMWQLSGEHKQAWLPIAFLILYTLFFCAAGLNQMLFGMVQGKLIRPQFRGELMGISGTIGATLSILCAWFFMKRWLALPDGGYGYIFGWTGVGFVIAGLFTGGLAERADAVPKSSGDGHVSSRGAWRSVLADRNFRWLAVVTMLNGSAQLLFPHYQALGRSQPDSEHTDLMIWVVVQNAATGAFSLIFGKISDYFGTRLAIRIESFVSALTPIAAIGLTSGWFPVGVNYYWITFALLGIVPVILRTLVLHALELTDSSRHAHYLGTLTVCQALPFLLSPPLGALVDAVGFPPVFLLIAGLILTAGALTFWMAEPRTGRSGA